MAPKTDKPARRAVQNMALFLGPLVSLGLMAFVDFSPGRPQVTRLAAVALLMAVWWITEAVPLAVTALLPVATPPNAIVFGSGRLRSQDMAKAGIVLNLLGVALVTATLFLWGRFTMGIVG